MLSGNFPAHLAAFRAGSVVAGYRLEAQVGAGGMAVVFRARDERLGRLVALKILAPALAADAAFRRRFVAEARAAAAADDPHIIPVYEAGEADGVLFIAMRFVKGGDLRLVLEREGPLPAGRAAGFISSVASALDAAHGAGLVHRDVKPANILVETHQDQPDHVYLSDFGASKGAISSVSLTGPGHFVGTADYAAPEQIQGGPVDGRTDQYALACVAYQLLTGATPFERDQEMAVFLAHLSQPPPSVGSMRPDLPSAADEVLARAMAKTPEKRYGSCRDFADALREALDQAPVAVPLRIEIARPRSEFTGADPAGTGTEAAPAGPTAAGAIDPKPGGGSARTADVPTAAVIAGSAVPGAYPETVSSAAEALAQGDSPAMAEATSQSAGTGTAGGSGALPGGQDQPTATAEGPASTTGLGTADQDSWSDPVSDVEVHPAGRPRRRIANRASIRTAWIRRHRLLVIALTVIVLAVAGVVPAVLAGSPSSPDYAAIVGGQRITISTLDSEVTNLSQAVKRYPGVVNLNATQVSQATLTWLIRYQINEELARRQGITVSTAQAQAALNQAYATAKASAEQQGLTNVTVTLVLAASGIPPNTSAELGRYEAIANEFLKIANGGTAPTSSSAQTAAGNKLNHAECQAAKALNIRVNPRFGLLDYSDDQIVSASSTTSQTPGPTSTASATELTPAC